ncbi:MAG: two-component sensor histidine kinase [Anaerolineaceae bacterium]|nr:two-component sensor histidine kinase [Anaerolineaceae bacterium]
MLKFIRSRLSWKVFLSYLVVIFVGAIVLATATNLSIPSTFDRHMAWMSAVMSSNSMEGNVRAMEQELFSSYRAAVFEALSLATIAASIAGLIASYFISRQVVSPIQRMMAISLQVTEGQYEQRLNVSGRLEDDQLDELGRLALAFNQMTDKLEKTEIMRGQLIGDVTHELRTPLTAIKGYMEGMRDGVIPTTPDTFQQIYLEAERLQGLVNDLQELSRVEAGAYQLNFELISPLTLVNSVIPQFQQQFTNKGVHLEINVEDNLPDISVDKDRIQQVFTNLLGNALQYTPVGGIVTITTLLDKDQIVFSIADTGIGISAKHLPYVFNRFYRTDKSRARASGGTGIGLTIAQALVKAHQGRIWVKSPGDEKGSTFFFSLPTEVKQ